MLLQNLFALTPFAMDEGWEVTVCQKSHAATFYPTTPYHTIGFVPIGRKERIAVRAML